MNNLIILLVIIIIIIVIIVITYKENFSSNSLKFKAPLSLTAIKTSINIQTNNINDDDIPDKFKNSSQEEEIIKDVNFINMPTFFYANEKWPGCLPRPLYQGTCGSCWGFATVSCLSSRFYIESCGNTGCDQYPQLNFGSLNQVYNNINQTYNFKKIFISDIINYIDTDKDKLLSKDEWINITKNNFEKLWSDKINNDEKHMIVQILVYMLDFQSLGSVNMGSKNEVIERANKTYNIWLKSINEKNKINIKKLEKYWDSLPLNLSAEKLISCCINCIEIDFQQQAEKGKILTDKNGKIVDNPTCSGGSLEDAWILLRDTGTTTTLCIGYNLDNYQPGDHILSCSEVQGPYYGFCSGYVYQQVMKDTKSAIGLRNAISEYKDSGEYPIAIGKEDRVPWIDPQLFRFRAKNAYTLPNNITTIQKEIIERGPVTTGFIVYSDFQIDFGQKGMGGQLYKKEDNPLGSSEKSLIYMAKNKEKQMGGHAIVIVGWGEYHYKEYKIPYWICLNSWGIEWGHSGFPDYNNRNGLPNDMTQGGYFWMVRGINDCDIEDNFVTGQPNIENITYPGVIDKYGWGLPGPNINSDINFLSSLNTNDLKLGNSNIELLPAIDAGGTFVDFDNNTWEMKSMNPPSPYTFFWPDNRPIYCLGISKNQLTKSLDDNIIHIDINTYKHLNTKNPLLIIDDNDNQEQVQLLEINKDNMKVKRAVNY